MRKLTLAILLATMSACNCNGDDNNGVDPDAGNEPDVTVDDDASMPDAGGEDVGGDAGPSDDADVLPQGVSIPGLSAPVTVRFDERGIPHLNCAVYADCLAAQGYYHAHDRFVQMDVQRRFATGRLAALIGRGALDTDIATRAILSTADGTPLEEHLWEQSAPATRDAISAYTRGVNAWIADYREGRNDARLSAEYELELVNSTIVDWTETDSIATGILLVEQLSNSADGDISRGNHYAALPPDIAFDVLGPMNALQVSTMQASGETYSRALSTFPDPRRLSAAQERLRPLRALLDEALENLAPLRAILGDPQSRGSNNWVIGGSLTASGMPIVANDPHLALLNPTLWYLANLDSDDGLHVVGASLPGLPGIQLGHNEHIAWGATVLFNDLADAYVEELTPDGQNVIFDGDEVPLIEVEHEFEIARGTPETHTLRFVPHHGPVVAYGPSQNAAISVRWTGHELTTDLDMFFDLALATNVDEARAAFAKVTTVNMNWIVADRNGDIGWFPFTAVPERPWASLDLPPWLPLPGDGSAEWGDPIPVDEQPQMINPASGFVVTANTDPTGTSFDGDPTNEAFGYQYSYGEVGGFRQEAIVRRVEALGDAHTADDSIAIQGDTWMILSESLLPIVRTAAEAGSATLSSDALALWGALDGWDGTCPTGLETSDPAGAVSTDADEVAASIGCSAFHYLVTALTQETFADELAGSGANPAGLEAIRTLVILATDPTRLTNQEAYWDDVGTDEVETRDATIQAALETAAQRIVARLGADPDEWQWGKLHTLRMYSNVFSDVGFSQYEAGPYAAPGGAFTINVANPNGAHNDVWEFSSGPSFRHVAEFTTAGIRSYWTLPGGQRHHRDSPHYNSLVEDWIDVRPFEMPFTSDAAEAAAVDTVVVEPRP